MIGRVMVDSRHEAIMIGPVQWTEEGWQANVAASIRYKSEITGRKAKFFIKIFFEWSKSCHVARSEPSDNSWAERDRDY